MAATATASRAHTRRPGDLTLYTHEVMTESQAVYLHLGYRETARRAEDGYRRIYLEKILPAPDQDSSAGGSTSS
jgi:hypothetical protein